MGMKFMEKTNGDRGTSYESVERMSVLGRENNKDENLEVEVFLNLMDQ